MHSAGSGEENRFHGGTAKDLDPIRTPALRVALGVAAEGSITELQTFMNKEMSEEYGEEHRVQIFTSTEAEAKLPTLSPARWLFELIEVSIKQQSKAISWLNKNLVPVEASALAMDKNSSGGDAGSACASSRTDDSTMVQGDAMVVVDHVATKAAAHEIMLAAKQISREVYKAVMCELVGVTNPGDIVADVGWILDDDAVDG